MENKFRWQVVSGREHGLSGRLCIRGSLLTCLLLHVGMAILTQLDAGKGVDGIVNTAVVRDVAAGHCRVGGIHDGVRSKGRDVALPQIEEGV